MTFIYDVMTSFWFLFQVRNVSQAQVYEFSVEPTSSPTANRVGKIGLCPYL